MFKPKSKTTSLIDRGKARRADRGPFLWLGAVILVAMSLVVGCKESPEDALHDTLNTTASSAGDWIELLEFARDGLVDDEKEELAAEVEFLLRAARATVNGASPCTAQQAEQRIRRVAEDILDALRHGDSTILPVEPLICLIDPPRLALEDGEVNWEEGEISGYDFDRADLTGEQMQLYLFTSSIEGEELTHVEWSPKTPSAFDATIDLWPVDQDLADTEVYRHLELWWGGERLRTIYMAGVVQLETVPIPSDARLFSFMPTEQSGDDRDFDGACQIDVDVELMIHPSDATKLVLQLDMLAVEEGRGTTKVTGQSDLDDPLLVVYEAEEGYEIEEIASPHPADCAEFKDEEHDVDFPSGSEVCGHGLVKQWRTLGDTDGDEAGTRTRVSVQLEDIEVQVVQLPED